MSNQKALKLNVENFSAVHRRSYPIAAGETIGLGQWFTLNAAGEAVLATAANGNTYMNFQDSNDPSVKTTQTDNFGDAGSVEIATGGVVGLDGHYRASLDNTAYDDGETYNQHDELTVVNGKLTPVTASEHVVAYVEKPIADGRLYIVVK